MSIPRLSCTSDGDCYSCADPNVAGAESEPEGECPNSPKPCGHHCNHSWTHDICHYCNYEWGEH